VCDEILNFSSIEYGAVALEERPFLLADLFKAIAMEFIPDAPVPAVTWPAGFVDGFVGDAAKMKTIIGNFVANAVKHAAGAPVEIVVTCSDTADGRAQLLVEVADGGGGVPAEEQELIFKRFVRGTRAKNEHVAGTGIGLA